MKCFYCDVQGRIKEHMLITINIANQTHVHGPFDSQVVMDKMVLALKREMLEKGLDLSAFNVIGNSGRLN